MNDYRTQLQNKLRELFQFDSAELDFGIYRIMNQKRAEVEAFISKDLLDAVNDALSVFTASASQNAEAEIAVLAKEVRQAYGANAIDANGNLSVLPQFMQLPLVLQFTAKQEEAKQMRVSAEQEAQVYNDLYTFFARYYSDGDFIIQPRFGRPKYHIPYNGEEVFFHWANRDQYYVKTTETFRDYAFRVQPGGFTVHFKLTAAQTEQNNNKGENRYFIPRAKSPVEFDKDTNTCTLFFEYRPLSDKEKETNVKNKVQEGINTSAALALVNSVSHATLKGLLSQGTADDDRSLLLRHLTKYTRRNTSDYFIHKNLRDFLERELEFFIKNEVFLLDDLGGEMDADTESYRRLLARAKVVRQIGRRIIAFLAQIEDFQKRLFEKKKFVVRTDWCITLDRVPEAFYAEVAASKEQWAEWERLFKVKKPKGNGKATLKFLKDHPSLVLDTQFFDDDFKDRLLATIDDLDEQTDGLLIHSENFQALRLLMEKYRERVKCIYIDPPYNTSSSSIPYKNNYRYSSWVTMMYDRLDLLHSTLPKDGAIFVSIDKTERTLLQHVLDDLFGTDNKVEELIWSMNTNNSQAPNYSTYHEYVLAYAKDRPTAELDRAMFREPKPGFEEVMALVARLNPAYPPIIQIEEEVRRLYELHKISYREEVEGAGLDWDDERSNDPWKGLYNYSNAEYRDSEGKLVFEHEAKEKQARIWIWREDDGVK